MAIGGCHVIGMAVVGVLVSVQPAVASHTWRVNEVFSNASGTIQFIELRESQGAPGETNVAGQIIYTSNYNFVIPLPNPAPPASFRHLLFATQAFADLPGAPTPDYIIPSVFFDPPADFVTYGSFDGVIFTNGQLPVDCIRSLNYEAGISINFNTPTNYAGETGFVNACGNGHAWGINEIFTTADGTVQFIELHEFFGVANANNINGLQLRSGSGTFRIPGPALTGSTANRNLLFATQSFANLPGAPTPDYIIPSNFFDPNGDWLSFNGWDVTPTFPPFVTDCVTSHNRLTPPYSGSTPFETASNSPTNYAGVTAQVTGCGSCCLSASCRSTYTQAQCQTAGGVYLGANTCLTASITPANPTVCADQPRTLTALVVNGTGSIAFLWNTGATTPSIDVAAPGSYSVTVTDALGCARTANVTVVECGACETQTILPNVAAGSRLGHAMAQAGDILAIGAHAEGGSQGSVYIYQRAGTDWQFLTKLVPTGTNPASGQFGYSVGLGANADVLIVGAPQATTTGIGSTGAATIFRRSGNAWTFEANLRASDAASNDAFGSSVAIDGDHVVIGAPWRSGNGTNAGAAYFFRRSAGVWTQGTVFVTGTGSQTFCGTAVALRNQSAFVGSVGNSSTASFTNVLTGNGMGNWALQGLPLTGGESIALRNETGPSPMIAIIGQPKYLSNRGSVHVYRNFGAWTQIGAMMGLQPGEEFGRSVAINSERDLLVIGAPGPVNASGLAYTFRLQMGAWSFHRTLTAFAPGPNDRFGSSVICLDHTDAQSTLAFALVGAEASDISGLDRGSAHLRVIRDDDCNSNYVLDYCEMHFGMTPDVNGNGVPDSCEEPPCPADIAPAGGPPNGAVDTDDLILLIGSWGACGGCPADIAPPGGNGQVNTDDLILLIGSWGPCP